MKTSKGDWNRQQEFLAFPTWFRSYHLLIIVIFLMMIFGAFIKQI